MATTLRAATLAFVCGIWLATASFAAAQTAVHLDPNHTTTNFSAKHLLISTVQGNIPVKSASIELGENDVPTAVEAVMDMTKIDTRNQKRDDDLRSDRFLDVAQYPEMTFKSTKVAPGSNGQFTMDGLLTIRGVAKPVVLSGVVNGAIKDKQGRTHVGYAASTTIDRTQFGVGADVPAAIVSDQISITIEAEAIIQ